MERFTEIVKGWKPLVSSQKPPSYIVNFEHILSIVLVFLLLNKANYIETKIYTYRRACTINWLKIN